MSSEQMDYAAILANLEAKRAALDATIASIRAAIVTGVLGQVGDIPLSSNGGSGGVFSPMMGGNGEIPAGAFLGKSIPDAAKLYLEIVKKKQTSKEISEALQKGGMESSSRNFQQIVHSVLDRARKANSGIVKLDRSYWGLASWYPAGLLRTSGVAQEKRPVPRKAAKRAKGAKTPPPRPSKVAKGSTQPSVQTVVVHPELVAKGVDARITELLEFAAPNGNSATDIATALREKIGVVNFSLVRLIHKGTARRGEDGLYHAAKDGQG